MEFTFTFTEQEAGLILNGLGELQAKQSIALIQKIQVEAQKQMQEQKTIREVNAEPTP
jgi:type III secretory pathway lipoprotein EscJ